MRIQVMLLWFLFTTSLMGIVNIGYAIEDYYNKEEVFNSKMALKVIGISQLVEHPALDAVRLGLLDSLNAQGFEEGKNRTTVYENAQGNLITATQIADKLLSMPIDVLVAISTPSAQTVLHAAQRNAKKVPIVFAAVSDPSAARLEPGSNAYPITGVTDAPNLQALLEVMNKMMPNLKTLGLLYNASEANSVSTIMQLKKLLKAKGITLQEVTISKTSEIAQSMQSLVGKVDALYFPQDNMVVSAIESVVDIAKGTHHIKPLPVFSSDPILVKRGVLLGVGFDYYEVGQETGRVVAKILNGEAANTIPMHSPLKIQAVINKKLAEKLGLTIPEKLQLSEIIISD